MPCHMVPRLAKLQYLSPSISCWQPLVIDTSWTFSSLSTYQTLAFSYSFPLNLHFHLSLLPLCPALCSSISPSLLASLVISSSWIQPGLSRPPFPHVLTSSLHSSFMWPSLSFSPCQCSILRNLFPPLTFDPGILSDTSRMSHNASHWHPWCHSSFHLAETSLVLTGPGTTLSLRNTAMSKAKRPRVTRSLYPSGGIRT